MKHRLQAHDFRLTDVHGEVGSFDGSILHVIFLSRPSDNETVHWSPLIVSLYCLTIPSGIFFPFSSKETMVHSPWNLSSSSFRSCPGVAASMRTTTRHGRIKRAVINGSTGGKGDKGKGEVVT